MVLCIYCKNVGQESREHILHDAFGGYKGALVLRCVCEGCNQRFGKTIDLSFTRDSPEAYLRYWRAPNSADKRFKSLGRRTSTRLETEDARAKHLIMHPVPLPELHRFGAQPAEQVVFTRGDRTIARLVTEVPRAEEMSELGFTLADGGTQISIMAHDPGPALAALADAGFPPLTLGEFLPMPAKTVSGMLTFTVTHPQLRAVAKIALNYLAYTMNAGFAMLPQFDRIRQYIRDDNGLDAGLVRTLPPLVPTASATREPRIVHWISIERRGHAIVARLCFFSETSYEVLLSELPFHVGFPLASCHVYDVENLTVHESRVPLRGDASAVPFAPAATRA